MFLYETKTTWEAYHIFSSSYYPSVSMTYAEHDGTEGKGNMGQPRVPFPFSLISKLKVEYVGRIYAYQEVK